MSTHTNRTHTIEHSQTRTITQSHNHTLAHSNRTDTITQRRKRGQVVQVKSDLWEICCSHSDERIGGVFGKEEKE